jgi:hypothetical protein
VEAFERLINLNAIALGILQVLARELPTSVWSYFPHWFRTLPNHGYPTERIVQLALQHQAKVIFSQSPPTLLLFKFLEAKLDPLHPPEIPTIGSLKPSLDLLKNL